MYSNPVASVQGLHPTGKKSSARLRGENLTGHLFKASHLESHAQNCPKKVTRDLN